MKKIFLGIVLAFSLGAVVFNTVKDQMIVNAYADAASLTPGRPVAGDQLVFWHNGSLVGINWTQFSRQAIQDVNWVGLSTTTGLVNWNYIGQ